MSWSPCFAGGAGLRGPYNRPVAGTHAGLTSAFYNYNGLVLCPAAMVRFGSYSLSCAIREQAPISEVETLLSSTRSRV